MIDGIDKPDGKFPKALGNVAIIESVELERLVRTTAEQASALIRQNLTAIDLLGELLQPYGFPLPNLTETVLQVLDTFDQLGNTTSINVMPLLFPLS